MTTQSKLTAEEGIVKLSRIVLVGGAVLCAVTGAYIAAKSGFDPSILGFFAPAVMLGLVGTVCHYVK